MAFVLLILALAVLAGIISGGSMRFLKRLRVHWWGLAPIALVLQSVPVPVGSAQRSGLAATSLRLELRAVAGGGRGESAGPRCCPHGGRPDDEPGSRRIGRRDAGQSRRHPYRGCRWRDRHRGWRQASPDVQRRRASAVGRRGAGAIAIRRGALDRRCTAVWRDGVVVLRRHTWTVPREPPAAGSPIPDVPGEACSGVLSPPGSVSSDSGEGSCQGSEGGDRIDA